MRSEFPRSPKFLKGALVVFETKLPIPTNLIVFQYNPDTMTRSFASAGGDAQTQSAGDTRPRMPPVESFQLTVELDAADQLENKNPLAIATGLHPTLAALELLLYPPSMMLILNKALTLVGSAIISPAQAPLVLFVWGAPRVVPVRVMSVGITEQAYDQLLNPIRAQVALGLRALTPPELAQAGTPFDTLGLVNQIAKEVLARLNVVNSVEQIAGMLPF
ncbi:MAG TPA: hypothetical protein VF538_09965 [Pyrinomonadaceae bacterium]|jgi:hypothetical protein